VETILIVDDEELIREVTRELLTNFGYNVRTAASGKEALEIYSREGANIDLVLTDLVMPGMNGAALFAELRKIDPMVKVIMVSGYAAQRENDRLLQAAGCLTKPYTVDSLLGMVRRVLDSPRTAGPV
jgi:CheY-like chemotaxis protein